MKRLFLSIIMSSLSIVSNLIFAHSSDTLLVHFTVNQCDSLIQANVNNPDFVVLDVRRPTEHNPEHLTGAINRDYYASDFDDQIDQLPRHKLYIIYCRSGGRSGNTFNLMNTMNFINVVNMLGGINAWKSEGLPVTSDFAPLLMAVSDTIITSDTIFIGNTDTMNLMITNRANDTLQTFSIPNLTGSEFSTDFDTSITILGSEDYAFSICYSPIDEIHDSLHFQIESDGGIVSFYINRTGIIPVNITETESKPSLNVYPNPFSTSTTLSYELKRPETIHLSIFNHLGQLICQHSEEQQQGNQQLQWNAEGFADGVYYYRLQVGEQVANGKMVKVI